LHKDYYTFTNTQDSKLFRDRKASNILLDENMNWINWIYVLLSLIIIVSYNGYMCPEHELEGVFSEEETYDEEVDVDFTHENSRSLVQSV